MNYIENKVHSYTGSQASRCLNAVRDHVFPIDAPAHHGGAPEALTPADAFLAGISACGVLLVEQAANQRAVHLGKVDVYITSSRKSDSPSWFDSIAIEFQINGCDTETASELVRYYEDG
jgi:uncharacterized OsmC-like protein